MSPNMMSFKNKDEKCLLISKLSLFVSNNKTNQNLPSLPSARHGLDGVSVQLLSVVFCPLLQLGTYILTDDGTAMSFLN